ncbi:hypothetical protein FBU59_002623 [Linderina macrospora]|uniref:Uncharacterized protein n=1 Tax=Linderina macrospora TaxID=4868 RepID=A0ACC1JAT0_9FUNG|nr:hypothetical protein FBU59_002623 [Linderina macrospora]
MQAGSHLAAIRAADGTSDPGDRLSLSQRRLADRLSLTKSQVDLLSLLSLRCQNLRLLGSLSDVDGSLARTLGFEDLSALAALGRHLRVHSLDDLGWRMDIANLVTQARNAPGFGRGIDGIDDVVVQRVALSQRRVQRHLADLRPHRRLCQLRNRELGISHAIRCLVGVDDAVVQHTVQLQRHVVLRNCALRRNLHCHLLQRLRVRDAVQERYQDRQPRIQDP